MTWQQQLELLNLMQKVIPQTQFALAPETEDSQVRSVFEEAERTTREAADAAVRAFSRSGEWPHISGEEAFFLRQRIQFAIYVTMALVAPDSTGERPMLPNPPPEFEKEDQVEWLLIAAWKFSGVHWWLEKALLQIQSEKKP